MRRAILALPLLLAGSALADESQWLPTAGWTPGVVNPKITQANIRQNICKKGWSTKSIRPPEDYTEALKKKNLTEPRYIDKNPKHYEQDHLISLELGGDPADPRNLWPQPYAGKCGARIKDRLEDKLHSLVCAGKVTLAEAQRAISQNWIEAYRKYIGGLVCQ